MELRCAKVPGKYEAVKPLLGLLLCTVVFAQDAPSELARLKQAALAGHAAAQFEYGRSIAESDPAESFAMILKAADQEYAAAENAVGVHFANESATDPKQRAKLDRLATRYLSRAAFRGIPEAQAKLSDFYARGVAVPKNPVLVYGWMALAVKFAGGPKDPRAQAYKAQLDQIIARTPSEVMAAGLKFADDFQSGGIGMNWVEVDILVAQMKVTSFYTIGGKKFVVVNQTHFAEGESQSVMVDGTPVQVTCDGIDGHYTARFRMGYYVFSSSSSR